MFKKSHKKKYLILNNYWKQISILITTIILISFFFPSGNTLLYSYKLNDVAKEEIVAPFNFPILKSIQELENDLDEALKAEPFYFIRDQQIIEEQTNKLNQYFNIAEKIKRIQKRLNISKAKLYRNRFSKKYNESRVLFQSDSTEYQVLLDEMSEQFSFINDNNSWSSFFKNDSLEINLNDLKKNIIQIIRNRWSEGIINISFSEIISNQIAVNLNDSEPSILSQAKLYNDIQEAWTKAKLEITTAYSNDYDIQRELGYSLVVEFMKPNIIYDQETTERRQISRQNSIPRNKGVILESERIVDRNTRITNDDIQKLNSLSIAIDEKIARSNFSDSLYSFVGRIIIISIIILFLVSYLLTFRKNIINDYKLFSLISFIIIFEIASAYVLTQRFNFSEYLIPIIIAAMVLTILFDFQIAFMSMVTTILLISIILGNDFEYLTTSLFTSLVAIYSVKSLRRRSQLFKAIFALIASSIFIVIGHGFFLGYSIQDMVDNIIALSFIAIISPLITYGLVGFFESIFNITTNLTLLELLDFQHPLLKRLQKEANGTFNHSIVVGNLAESCADAIGANSLLCRVGAYYHDLGKMVRPEYYIENQYGGDNKHDGLTPVMSAKIIKNHVIDGLKLAKEYGLPKKVSDFIPMHHGTTRVEYFYRTAVKSGEKVDEQQFCYPGPKPNTKETGILMICEAVEAAVRSIKDPDIFKIEEMISNIIDSRIASRQLSDCPLTMDELSKIKGKIDGSTGLLPVLRGIYHIRIEYPDSKAN